MKLHAFFRRVRALWPFLLIVASFLVLYCISNIPFANKRSNSYSARRQEPLVVWIVGIPRSGTTLFRVLLDAHPDVNCGPETVVLPRVFHTVNIMFQSAEQRAALAEAGISEALMHAALGAFAKEVLEGHAMGAPVLCAKDPLMFGFTRLVLSAVPNSRFIILVRDGRAVVHSFISRNLTLNGWRSSDYESNLRLWNEGAEYLWRECVLLGVASADPNNSTPHAKNSSSAAIARCLQVPYELLVLEPERWMQRAFAFLDLRFKGEHHAILAAIIKVL